MSLLQTVRLACAMVIGLLMLGGCSSNDMSDLQAFVAQTRLRQKARIEPLPAIKIFETYAYQADGRRDPFEPPSSPDEVEECSDCPVPDNDRPREELERFSLDSLRMVGTLEQEGSVWGLVQTPESTVFRVVSDNYMGQNHGRIERITADRIELTELVSDGVGAWRERPAGLALSE